MPISLILVNPEIPQNTGNIIRLCANMGADLKIVKPMGFELNDKRLRRAHLYYDEFASIKVYDSWYECYKSVAGRNIYAIETGSSKTVFDIQYGLDDVLVFGSESSGLSSDILHHIGSNNILNIPMLPKSRSLNLANCASIVLYETWRQNNFYGGEMNMNNFNFANENTIIV